MIKKSRHSSGLQRVHGAESGYPEVLNEALEQQAVLRLDGIFPLQESGLKSDDIAYGMFRKICASNSAIHQRLSLIKNCQ